MLGKKYSIPLDLGTDCHHYYDSTEANWVLWKYFCFISFLILDEWLWNNCFYFLKWSKRGRKENIDLPCSGSPRKSWQEPQLSQVKVNSPNPGPSMPGAVAQAHGPPCTPSQETGSGAEKPMLSLALYIGG